eukprot:scaffold12431_cov58-Phaeocystis_antarctica.AAC.4
MSAVRPWQFGRSMLAPRFSSSLTISTWLLAAAVCSMVAVVGPSPSPPGAEQNASTGPSLRSHLTTFCSSPRSADRKISLGSGAGALSAGLPASGVAAGEVVAVGSGRVAVSVWPSCSAHCRAVWPSLSSSSVLALARSRASTHASFPPAAAIITAVASSMFCWSGLGLHARSLPLLSGRHQGGSAVDVLQVGVGRVLQERRGRMERWPWSAACTSAVRPRLLGRSMLAPRFSSSLTICRWLLTAAACSRVEVVGRPSSVRSADRVGLPSLAQPLDHLLQLAPLRRPVDLFGKWGGRAHRCSASLVAAAEADSSGPARECAADRARLPSLGRAAESR